VSRAKNQEPGIKIKKKKQFIYGIAPVYSPGCCFLFNGFFHPAAIPLILDSNTLV